MSCYNCDIFISNDIFITIIVSQPSVNEHPPPSVTEQSSLHVVGLIVGLVVVILLILLLLLLWRYTTSKGKIVLYIVLSNNKGLAHSV